MQRKYATAYRFADRVMLHSHLQTDYGNFACGPFQKLDPSTSAEEIGRCVRMALDSSQSRSEMPNVKDAAKAFLAGLGVKSNAQLQRSAVCVGITQARELQFEPTHNGGTAGDAKGFQPIPGAAPICVPPDASDAQIGQALLQAFSLCTTIYAS
jgi:CDI immunity protein